MSNKKQTAVEWFIKTMSKKHSGFAVYVNANIGIIDKAKAMEKEQIMQSLNDGKAMAFGNKENQSLEQYYNETYN